ncbi:MAG: HlyC/CorC family transporter [Oscillospiraceae bacterium]|nr:HlyC/CorC family transporter [Oscillospiraceae bacterium]
MDGVDGSIFLQAAVIAVLILCSAFFSSAETAFLSFNRIKMKNEADDGDKKAKRILRMAEDYDKLLSVILIGNNIVNILASSLSTILFARLILNRDLSVTVSTAVMTVLVLIFGEITPKTLAKRLPDSFVRFAAPVLAFISVLLTPLAYVFNKWQSFISGWFKDSGEDAVTEEELLTIIDEATEGGELEEQEGELIKNAVKFYDLDVTDILTPRVDMEGADISWDRSRVADMFNETGFSRLPVYDDTPDDIQGVLYQKDFFRQTSDRPWTELIRPATYVYAEMKVSRLLKLFQESKSHMVIVQDDYGGTVGVVTLEDVLEELVGDIYDEHDDAVVEFRKITDTIYIVDGAASIDDFFEKFELKGEPVDDISTVGGFATHQLGKIPSVGESFEYEHLRIVVNRTDMNRVQSVKVFVGERPAEKD